MAHLNDLGGRLAKMLKKYKYAALVLLLGIALLLLPSGKSKKEVQESKTVSAELDDDGYAALTEQRLTQMLSQIDGAGRVEVMLTLRTGGRTRYQTDTQLSESTTEDGT